RLHECLAAQRLDLAGEHLKRRALPRGEGQVGALAREGPTDVGAHALGGAGDDGDAALEPSRHAYPSRRSCALASSGRPAGVPSPAEPGRSACSSTRSGYSASMTSTGVFMTFDMWTRMADAPSRAAAAPSPPPWTS